MAIAHSDRIGICLCVGCWLEGGASMEMTPYAALRAFAERKQLFKVHVRNVSGPAPEFVETFIDDGYGDMYRIIRELAEANFDGIVIADHVPLMLNDKRLATSYTIGYLKALIRAAEDDSRREEPLPA